jgi:hypothetical protein
MTISKDERCLGKDPESKVFFSDKISENQALYLKRLQREYFNRNKKINRKIYVKKKCPNQSSLTFFNQNKSLV